MKLLRFALIAGIPLLAALLHAEPAASTQAPAWRLKDVDGREISSEQFKGKVVVVDFWATWCGPCRMEIPGYVALQKKYGRDKLAIIGMSVDEQGPAVVKKFIAAHRVDYQIVMADEAVQRAFTGGAGVEAIPTTFIIDAQGNIRDQKTGAESEAQFEERLLRVMK